MTREVCGREGTIRKKRRGWGQQEYAAQGGDLEKFAKRSGLVTGSIVEVVVLYRTRTHRIVQFAVASAVLASGPA